MKSLTSQVLLLQCTEQVRDIMYCEKLTVHEIRFVLIFWGGKRRPAAQCNPLSLESSTIFTECGTRNTPIIEGGLFGGYGPGYDVTATCDSSSQTWNVSFLNTEFTGKSYFRVLESLITMILFVLKLISDLKRVGFYEYFSLGNNLTYFEAEATCTSVDATILYLTSSIDSLQSMY